MIMIIHVALFVYRTLYSMLSLDHISTPGPRSDRSYVAVQQDDLAFCPSLSWLWKLWISRDVGIIGDSATQGDPRQAGLGS